MFYFLIAWLGLLSLAAARPADIASLLGKRGDGVSPPRSIMYVQTFRTTSGGQLSLLPLIQQNTQVTHIYLAAVHINDSPGDINLNDDNPNSTMYDTIWQEAAQLQQAGVKVMMMLGGAAPGSYPKLCSGQSSVIVSSRPVKYGKRLIGIERRLLCSIEEHTCLPQSRRPGSRHRRERRYILSSCPSPTSTL